MNYKEFHQEVSRGTITCVYFFNVSDTYIADSYLEFLKEKMGFSKDEMLNISQFDEKNISWNDLYSSLNMLPIAAERRLVIVKKNSLFKDKELSGGLEKYLSNPNPDTVLVIYSDSPDKRSSLYKAIAAGYKEVVFTRLEGKELTDWINSSFKKHGLSADESVANYLSEALKLSAKDGGINMGYVAKQIEKLAFGAQKQKKITLSDIMAGTSFPLSADVFAYSNALCEGDAKRATRLLTALLAAKVPGNQIIALAASSFRRLALCGYLKQNGYSEAEVAKTHGLHPYAVKIAFKLSAYTGPNDALMAINELSYAERLSRRGDMDLNDALFTITQSITAKTFVLGKSDRLFSSFYGNLGI